MRTIDMTPTWGEIGLIYTRLAESKEVKAIQKMRTDVARAFAAAAALEAIQSKLPEDLNEIACKVVVEELAKQGF